MNYIEREKEKIISELIEEKKIRLGQLIDYEYFREIYEPYKNEMDEKVFAELLEISYGSYMNMKSQGARARVLKSRINKITEEEKEEIIEKLIRENRIRPGQLINYEYFKKIYEPYKNKMDEEAFAGLLEITYDSYHKMKSQVIRAKVLKSRVYKITKEEQEEIIKELVKSNRIKSGQSIDYEYFKKIYEPYKDKIDEKDFAKLLEINYSNYMSMKNRKQRARVLKSRANKITEEEREKIIEELIKGKQIKQGQAIDYEYFKKIYEPYKEKMDEKAFAELLEITYASYRTMKNQGQRAKVLTGRVNKIAEEEQEKIINEWIAENKTKPGQLIGYEYFKKIYEPYKNKMDEEEFAKLLEINYSSYNKMKNRGTRVKLLMSRISKITEEEQGKIISELIEGNNIKPGQLIDYEYFKEIYAPYKNKMNETDFAELLEISYGSYLNMKNQEKRARVLKSKVNKITKEEQEEIINKLIEEKKIKPGQLIDYEYFKKIYEPYKEKMGERVFAELLEIAYGSYNGMKNQGTKAKLLKSRENKITEEEREDVINELIKGKKIRIGQLIDYKYFKKIYEPYKDKMDEKTFVELLGITYANYMHMKHNGTRVKVNDYRIKEKIDRIKYKIKKEVRYYTKEEIENICKEFDIEIDVLLQYLCCNGREKFVTNYIDILEKKGKVWIGQTECSREFANRYSRDFIKIAKNRSYVVCKRYGLINEQEDIASDALEDMLYKWGDIEKNFGDNAEVVKERISARTYINMKYKCLQMLQKPRVYSFHRTFTSGDSEEEVNVFDRGIKDDSINVQEEAERKILKEIKEKQKKSPEEAWIDLLKANIEICVNIEEAIKKTGEMLGINPEKMLEALQKYMIEQKRVRKTASGDFIMGE